jgi:1-deoxy-D-xylulose 5-phosphate reductoisomerase
VAVAAFLEGRIGFLDIAALTEDVLSRVDGSPAPRPRRAERSRRARPRAGGGRVSFLLAILGLALLVLIHEAGHFFAARAVGMKPRKFYVGFPPPLVKRVHNGIEYGIGRSRSAAT